MKNRLKKKKKKKIGKTEKKTKKKKNNYDNLMDPWNCIQIFNFCIIGIQRKEERQ